MRPEVAIVVDVLGERGGAEKVLLAALELFPRATIYSLMYNPVVFEGTEITKRRVVTSLIDRLPYKNAYYRRYLPIMPWAIEQFDLSRYDLVLSFSYAVAHGVRTQPGQLHVSYTYTPMRYAWRDFPVHEKLASINILKQGLLRAFRSWDLKAAQRVSRFAASSCAIEGWVQAAYHRPAQVIYPPVEVGRFVSKSPRQDYYITVSRLAAHKRIDLVVEAFSRLRLPLVVVGDGPELTRLQRMAADNVQFPGFISDERLRELLASARAFVSAAEEDFGIAMVEAQAAGCPVISYGKGGALETVIEGETGLFFERQDADSLVEAVQCFQKRLGEFDPRKMRANARRFSKGRFLEELDCLVRESPDYVSQSSRAISSKPR